MDYEKFSPKAKRVIENIRKWLNSKKCLIKVKFEISESRK